MEKNVGMKSLTFVCEEVLARCSLCCSTLSVGPERRRRRGQFGHSPRRSSSMVAKLAVAASELTG